MQSHHWLGMIVVLIAGYALGRYFPQPGQTIGLP